MAQVPEYTGDVNDWNPKDFPAYVGYSASTQALMDALTKAATTSNAAYTKAVGGVQDILSGPDPLAKMGLDPQKLMKNAGIFISRSGDYVNKAADAALARNRSIGKLAWGELGGQLGGSGNLGSTVAGMKTMDVAGDFMNAQAGVEAARASGLESAKMGRIGLVSQVGGTILDSIQRQRENDMATGTNLADLALKEQNQQFGQLLATFSSQLQLDQLPQEYMNMVYQTWLNRPEGTDPVAALVNAAAAAVQAYAALTVPAA
jgi:hypothetical protein